MEKYVWTEKYRPTKMSDCVLPARIRSKFEGARKTGQIPDMILHGAPGCGKTSVAIALCKEIGAEYLLINSSDERNIDTLRMSVQPFASSSSLSGQRKCVIFDEADFINRQSTQPALRGFIERYSSNCAFIFTCNYKQNIMPEIHSRCSDIGFQFLQSEKKELCEKFYNVMTWILSGEKVEFDKKVLVAHILNFYPDFRRTIKELQIYANINHKIDSGILVVKPYDIKFLVDNLKAKKFQALHEWATGQDYDRSIFSRLFEDLYDGGYLTESSIPTAVLLFFDYEVKSLSTLNFGMCLTSCLTQFMIDCELKP